MIELAAASLHLTGSLRLRVTGSSMLPAVRPGDVLSVRACDLAQADRGDVILFRRGGRLFAHRVTDRGARSLAVRGDAVRASDDPVGPSEVLGKVVAIERRGRTIVPGAASGFERLAASVFRRSPLAGRLFTRWNARSAAR